MTVGIVLPFKPTARASGCSGREVDEDRAGRMDAELPQFQPGFGQNEEIGRGNGERINNEG